MFPYFHMLKLKRETFLKSADESLNPSSDGHNFEQKSPKNKKNNKQNTFSDWRGT